MKKSFYSFLILVGTVIGSGFLSGKEIVVFFSRFGVLSYPCIILATFLFAGVFFFLLTTGVKAVKKLEKSRFSNIINIIICTILASAMFAGCFNVLSKIDSIVAYILIFIIAVACFLINKRGLGSLEKANLVLVPVMVVLLIGNIISQIKCSGASALPCSYLGLYYAIMYVILNTASSGVLLANLGDSLTKKQKAQVSIFSALVLGAILLLANFVLLQNPSSFDYDMPLISLFSGLQGALMQLVVLFGCLTTLFSAVFTLYKSLRGLINSYANAASVIAPLAISFVGFGNIVSSLYPLSSVLGIFLLFDLFLMPFLKQTYKSIHSTRNDTK